MNNEKIEIGKLYGNLKVLSFDHQDSKSRNYWKCLCTKCNTEIVCSEPVINKGFNTKCKCHYHANNLKDITGEKFGKLTVIKFAGQDNYRQALWECRCDCGNITTTTGYNLRSGKVISCGKCHAKMEDITGRKYGRLLVKKLDYIHPINGSYWICECECGTIKSVSGNSLRTGKVLSCGCLRDEEQREAVITHGMSKQKIYKIWAAMIQRCHDPNCAGYYLYGGNPKRSVQVCDRWRQSFENFYEDMGSTYEEGLTIDRYPDREGDYCPENCRWISNKNQQNNKSDNSLVKIGGLCYTYSEACSKFAINGIDSARLGARLSNGWTLQEALEIPSLTSLGYKDAYYSSNKHLPKKPIHFDPELINNKELFNYRENIKQADKDINATYHSRKIDNINKENK